MRLAFVGDIALGDHPKTVGFGFRSRYPDGIPSALSHRLLPPGPVPALMLGNLEFPLAGAPAGAGLIERQCRGLEEYATFLAHSGISALNVANNHSLQHGPAVFRATIDVVRRSGIHVVGTPDDFSASGVLRVGDRRIALLGWSDRPRQYGSEPPPYNELSDAACERIAEARSYADLVIASVHWGHEFILVPSDRERRIGRAMIDAGAALVIGHHPHVVREVERYHDGFIAYSLGNFVGDMVWDARTRVGGWLTARLGDDGVRSVELVPAIIDDDYFPRPPTTRETRTLLRRIAADDRAQRQRLAMAGYEAIAESERRRHVRHTVWMMLRNLRRYPRGVAVAMFRHAVAHRMRHMLARGFAPWRAGGDGLPRPVNHVVGSDVQNRSGSLGDRHRRDEHVIDVGGSDRRAPHVE